jgi:protein-tyrosine phosphatase/membrane-associated phospholipid phosphatase
VSRFPLYVQGLPWLIVLAPLFFITYGAANHWAAALGHVPSVVFDWESHIPFVPWTILPYWSIDLFYGLSLLVASSPLELRRQVARLLTTQMLCVVSFMCWPLRFSSQRPHVDGVFGQLFDALMGFDLPYNQAPSLHIVLLVVYRRRASGWVLTVCHVWSALIAVSVLTTYQHHFVDVPTGLLAGCFVLWLWPLDAPRPVPSGMVSSRRWQLAGAYATGAALCMGLAWWGATLWSRVAWWLMWPAAALLGVSLMYGLVGASGFQKDINGRLSVAVRVWLAPYRVLAWLNARWWTRRLPASVLVRGQVHLGRLPLPWERDHRRYRWIVDMTAELAIDHAGVKCMPLLDLVVPQPESLLQAATWVQQLSTDESGPGMVCCALGMSRSAAVVITWLCLSDTRLSVGDALLEVRRVRPEIVVSASLLRVIEQAVQLGRHRQVADVFQGDGTVASEVSPWPTVT